MLDGVATLMAVSASSRPAARGRTRAGATGSTARRTGTAATATADGRFVTVAALEPQFYAELLERLELDAGRVAAVGPGRSGPRCARAWRAPRDPHGRRVGDRLEGTDACFAPVLRIDEAAAHPHVAQRGTFVAATACCSRRRRRASGARRARSGARRRGATSTAGRSSPSCTRAKPTGPPPQERHEPAGTRGRDRRSGAHADRPRASGEGIVQGHPSRRAARADVHGGDRTGRDRAGEVEDVLCGCAQQFGEQGFNVGRNAWLHEGLPVETPATTIDRQCGSAQQAVNFAAAMIAASVHDCMIAAGVEHMGHISFAAGYGAGVLGSAFTDQLLSHQHDRAGRGSGAELIAEEYEIARAELDELALRSHRLAAAATDEGTFEREIVPFAGRTATPSPPTRASGPTRRSSSSRAQAGVPPDGRDHRGQLVADLRRRRGGAADVAREGRRLGLRRAPGSSTRSPSAATRSRCSRARSRPPRRSWSATA